MRRMVDEAQRLAAEYERKCTGCAQSVVAGLLDAWASMMLMKASSGRQADWPTV